jgi:hypothetical protein
VRIEDRCVLTLFAVVHEAVVRRRLGIIALKQTRLGAEVRVEVLNAVKEAVVFVRQIVERHLKMVRRPFPDDG